MKQYALTILAVVAISETVKSASATGPKEEKPNILVIFIDDMEFADPSCFGNPLVKTPHIDKLKKRTVVRSSAAVAGSTHFEANWNSKSEMLLKVNNKLVEKAKTEVIQREPADSIQIGADLSQPVGNYNTPNHFTGIIENLTFKYPNGPERFS